MESSGCGTYLDWLGPAGVRAGVGGGEEVLGQLGGGGEGGGELTV